MSEFKIEKGIPAPKHRPASKAQRTSKYPWRNMEIGDSVAIPNKTKTNIYGSLAHASRTTGFQFTTRPEHLVNGVRVWRTA